MDIICLSRDGLRQLGMCTCVHLHAYPVISLPLFNHRPQSEQVGGRRTSPSLSQSGSLLTDIAVLDFTPAVSLLRSE